MPHEFHKLKLQLTKFQLALAYKVTMFAVFVGCSICSCSVVVVVVFVSNRDSSYAIGIFNLYEFSKSSRVFQGHKFLRLFFRSPSQFDIPMSVGDALEDSSSNCGIQ